MRHQFIEGLLVSAGHLALLVLSFQQCKHLYDKIISLVSVSFLNKRYLYHHLQVIDSKTFTKTEDHEVLIEKKAYELQHRPVEKEYVVETRFVGEARVPGGPTELVGTEAREVNYEAGYSYCTLLSFPVIASAVTHHCLDCFNCMLSVRAHPGVVINSRSAHRPYQSPSAATVQVASTQLCDHV